MYRLYSRIRRFFLKLFFSSPSPPFFLPSRLLRSSLPVIRSVFPPIFFTFTFTLTFTFFYLSFLPSICVLITKGIYSTNSPYYPLSFFFLLASLAPFYLLFFFFFSSHSRIVYHVPFLFLLLPLSFFSLLSTFSFSLFHWSFYFS